MPAPSPKKLVTTATQGMPTKVTFLVHGKPIKTVTATASCCIKKKGATK